MGIRFDGRRGRMAAALLACAACFLPLVGCSDGGGGGGDLHLIEFTQDQQVGIHRDQVLSFEFSARVDPATIDPDTFQIFAGTAANSTPFLGIFEVDGRFVHFHPAVDENDMRRGSLPLNPYGFEENTAYRVRIPSKNDTPLPLKILTGTSGKEMRRAFSGAFTVGTEFRPRPGEGAPAFAPHEPAVFNMPGSAYQGTAEPFDDVLSFAPSRNPAAPPLHPVSGLPDFRAAHPTHVRAQLTFTEVMDPRSLRSQDGGNILLQFNSPNSNDWNFIPTTVTHSPNGRTFILTAATPLAHATRFNQYRVVIDPRSAPLVSRAGKELVMAVETWDDVRKRMMWVDISEPHLTFWCAKVAGEVGPLLTATFPLESFALDGTESDVDVAFDSGRASAGRVVARASEDRTHCSLPNNGCSLALREPFTQSASSTKPNPNNKGASKIQFLYNSPQHAGNAPNPAYKLADAEALTGMDWGPLCATVVKSTYPKLHIQVMWSNRNATSGIPAGLASTVYNNNFDQSPPGFAVRDGKTAYAIEQSSASATWYPWKFERPFTDYRIDKGLVFMAWTEEGGDVEQYPRWYSPNNTPNTRIFSSPSTRVNPSVGQAGQWCYYWTRFQFQRIRSLAVSRFFRMTAHENETPQWYSAIVSPSPAVLPGGTHYVISYRGAEFNSYSLQGGRYARGEGTPVSVGDWDRNATTMNEYPAVAIRVVFTANPAAPKDLPYIDQVALTYRLK